MSGTAVGGGSDGLSVGATDGSTVDGGVSVGCAVCSGFGVFAGTTVVV